MTHEYLRAVETYHLSYLDLKRMARQSLEHSFLPGSSLWTDTKLVFRMAPACSGDTAALEKPSAACEEFLAANERAHEQWKLETEFAKFEKKY
jgi:adenosine deaminase